MHRYRHSSCPPWASGKAALEMRIFRLQTVGKHPKVCKSCMALDSGRVVGLVQSRSWRVGACHTTARTGALVHAGSFQVSGNMNLHLTLLYS